MSSFSSLHLLYSSLILLISFQSTYPEEFINVYVVSSLDGGAVAAMRLAIEQINNYEPDILSNYTLQLIELDTSKDTTVALQRVLEIKEEIEDTCPCTNSSADGNITMPIVLGCPRSSTSSITAPVLDTINWAQLSSGATSILLSDQSKYPTFYRSIADDALQAAGIVGMLKSFEWTKVAVVYVNDLYGAYLAIEIMNLASADNSTEFEVTPIAFNSGDNQSISSAVTQLARSDVFITVLVAHDDDLSVLFKYLVETGLHGYPYYYIATDAWLTNNVMGDETSMLGGYIGTAPWGTNMLSAEKYNTSSDLEEMYNSSLAKLEYFESFWETQYANDSSWANGYEEPSTYSYYAWDNVYAISYVADYILNTTGNLTDLGTTNISWINDILTNQIDFIGVTGRVSFADNGDRDKGLFAFGNVLENGSVSWIGYFSEYYEVTYVDYSSVQWPSDFEAKNMEPRTSPQVTPELTTINTGLFITITILAGISILVAIALVVLTAIYSEDEIMRAASWRLNIAVCIGAVMAYVYVIISGFDEEMLDKSQLDGICVCKMWILSVAFTLGAMPLFLKTYRVSVIFTESLKMRKGVKDIHLVIRLQICVVIDIITWGLYTLFASPFTRQYKDGSLETVDDLQQLQHIYGVCSSGDSTENTTEDYVFKSIIAIWKTSQIIFGIFCCLIVSRISNKAMRDLMRKFDESSTQLVAVVTIISLSAGMVILFLLIPDNEHAVNWDYGIQSVGILVICNVCLSMNLCPRLIAIWKGDQDRLNHSLEEEMRSHMIEQMSAWRESKSMRPSERSKSGTNGVVSPGSDSYAATPTPKSPDSTQGSLQVRATISPKEGNGATTSNTAGHYADDSIMEDVEAMDEIHEMADAVLDDMAAGTVTTTSKD